MGSPSALRERQRGGSVRVFRAGDLRIPEAATEPGCFAQ
jgi:hypothetical protein